MGGIVIKKYFYVNGNERFAIENIEHFKVLVNAGKITKETVLFDEEAQAWIGVLQIPEFNAFFAVNMGAQYQTNQQYQQQANPSNYQNQGVNQNQNYNPNQGYNPNPNQNYNANQGYNQGQGFNYNVNYPSAPKKNKTVFIVLAIVLIVAALGAAAYFLFIKDSGSKNKEKPAFELTNKASASTNKISGLSGKDLSEDQEKQASEKMLSILSAANSNKNINIEPESSEKYGSLAPVIRITQEYYSKLQNAKNSIQGELNKLDIQSVFTQKVLGSSASIQSMKDKLSAYGEKYEEYEDSIRNSLTEFKNKLNRLDMPSSVRSGLVDSFEKTSEQSMAMMEEFFKAEEDFLENLDELLSFLQDRQGEYKVDNGQVQFNSDEDVDAYNKIYKSIQESAQKEVDLQKQMTERSQNSINNLEDALN